MPKTKSESVASALLQIRVPIQLSRDLRRAAKENAETLTALCRRVLFDAVTKTTHSAPKRRKADKLARAARAARRRRDRAK